MEIQQQMLQNGQELQTGDVNNMGAAALMDDRLLAEVLRMLPNTGSVSRLILPYAVDNDDTNTTVQPSGNADGKVIIMPFRAVIGSRTAVATDAVKGWRDIRSGIFVGGNDQVNAVPVTSLSYAQGFTANSSGNARWDLVYAVITPDAGLTSVLRAVKTSTTGIVNTSPTVTQLATRVQLGVVTGTPAASPTLPSAPADGGGIYYIPLAYVLIPNTFGPSSTIKTWHIMPAAPTPISMSKGLGGASAKPADQQNAVGGTVVTAANAAAWANNSTSSISARPAVFMPSDMIGREDLFVAISIPNSTPANWSHPNGGLVDGSRDWRNRMFKTTMMCQASGGAGHFAWDRVSGNTALVPAYAHATGTPEAMAGNIALQMGQSFLGDAASLPGASPPTGSVVCYASGTVLSQITGSGGIGLYVDTSGVLRVYVNVSGGFAPNALFVFWVEASRGFGNY